MKKFISLSVIAILTFSCVLMFMGSGTVFAEGEDDTTEDYYDYSGDGGVTEGDGEYDPYEDYVGEIDIFTGLPVNSSQVTDEVNSDFVVMQDGSIYDVKNDMYRYSIDEDVVFAASVCDGMVVTDTVALALTGEANVRIYKDGNQLDGIPSKVSDPGAYAVISWSDSTEDQLMTFKIVGKTTSRIGSYIMPEDFVVSSVTLDGAEQSNRYGSVDMSQEGYYEIHYRCTANKQEYDLAVTIDNTPPDIIVEGLDENNKAWGPVTIKGLDDVQTLSIKLGNDDKKLNSKHQLTESGNYTIIATDFAGNTTQRNFTIMIYLNVNGTIFLAIMIAIILGVFIALYITRKRLRVR